MARYQGHVAVFRATVPLGAKTPDWQFPAQTVVDTHTSKKWKDLGLVPSDVAPEEVFVRRAYLDLTGTLPTPKQVQEFVADKDAKKRDALVDRLVDSPESAYYFANKWADILRVKRGRDGGNSMQRAQGTFAFHNWIREAIASDKPYDEFVRDILSATGEESKNPPTVWYKDLQNSSWTTRPRCSSGCGSPAPTATTTRTRSGARTTTGAWPPSSAGWPRSRSRSPARSSRRTCRSSTASRTAG
jgi:hypothetical protein